MSALWKSLTLVLLFAQCSYGFFDLGGGLSRVMVNHLHPTLLHNFTVKAMRSCPEYEQELEGVYKEVRNCFEEYDSQNESLCRFVNNNLRRCLNPLKVLFQKCLPSESKDVPPFIIDSFMSLANFTCTAKGKTLVELVSPCIRYLDSYENCTQKISEEFEQYKETFPTKSEICHFLGETRLCLKQSLQKSCDASVTWETFLSFYDAVYKDCKNAAPYVKANEVLDKESF